MSISNLETILILLLTLIRQSFLIKLDLESKLMHNNHVLYNISSFQKTLYLLPTMKVCVGTPSPQCFSLAISTITSEIYIESTLSKTVFNHQFDKAASKTYDRSSPKTSCGFVFFHNLNVYLEGIGSQDVFYLPTMTPPQKFLLFTLIQNNNRKEIETMKIDGVVGLRLQKEIGNYTTSLIDYLFLTNLIDKRNFALSINAKGNGNITIGEQYPNINYCRIKESPSLFLFWNCKVNKITIGKTKVHCEDNLISFHSVMSVVVATYEPGKFILDHIVQLSNGSCHYKQDLDLIVLQCEQSTNVNAFPDIVIFIDNTYLVIEWKNLFIEVTVNETPIKLSLFLVHADQMKESWTIGIPGFIDNTIFFDFEERRIGIVPRNIQISTMDSISVVSVILIVILSFGVGLLVMSIFVLAKHKQ